MIEKLLPSLEMAHRRRRSALWIEDDPAIVRWGRDVLTRAGFTVETARTGGEGLAQARAGHHDVILLDWRLPAHDMNGCDVLRTVRAEGVITPVMVCTGYFSGDEEQQARVAGADDFYPKPFRASQWIDRIETLLQHATLRSSRDGVSYASSERFLVWHVRLLAGDVAAQTEVATALLPLLCRRLARCHPRADEAAVNTAVEEALVEYFSSPDAYDPDRLPLDAYVRVISQRRLSNLVRAATRRLAHEVATGDALPDRPVEPEARPSRWRELRMVLRCCQTKQEHAFLRARLRGERRTEVLASILSVEFLPAEAQRAEIHRVMERLRFRIRSFRRRTFQE